MALFRRFSVLLTTLLLAATGGLAADQPLNLETVIAKARGAAAVDDVAAGTMVLAIVCILFR